MPNIEGLQADPKFKALPPERQQALLSHLGGGGRTPQPQGFGAKVSELYGKIAQPVTSATAKGLAEIYDPAKYSDETPVEKLPPFAREVAEFVIPQTPTSAAITAGSMLLPAAGAARVLGEAAGPVERIVGTRLGRIASGTAIGAGAGAISGEGAGPGALQGAASMIPGETLGRIGQAIGSHAGEGSVIRQTTSDFGKAITASIPWVGKLEKGSDFADAFIHGKAVQRAGDLLRGVKKTLSQRTKGYGFDVAVPTSQGITKQTLPFAEADELITKLQQGYGFTPAGGVRAGPTAREARHMGYAIRDSIAGQLNKFKNGLGDAYLKARKQFDAAKTLSDVFDKRDLIGMRGINQPRLIDRMNEYSPDLDRALGPGTAKRLLETLRRGFIGEGKDIPGHAGKGHISVGLFGPHYRRIGGQAFDPIGEVPTYIRPSGAPIEAAISNAIVKANKPEQGPGVKSLNKSRAEHLAPTPSASDRAEKVSMDLNSGKTPEVHADLGRGRLSMDEVTKLLKHGSRTDAAAMVEGVPLTEALDAAEVANENERKMLLPLIAQKMQAQFKDQKYNRTLAANLARRFKALQSGGVSGADEQRTV